MKSYKKVNVLLWLDYVAIAIIVIAFFVISYCGFFTGDDFVMDYGISSISDVFERTKNWYFTLGGRSFSVASQYLFVGVLGDNKVWFDIMNTVFFLLLLLACGKTGAPDKFCQAWKVIEHQPDSARVLLADMDVPSLSNVED